MNIEEVYTSDLLVAFEDIAKVWGGELTSETIKQLAVAIAQNKQALLPWLSAQRLG